MGSHHHPSPRPAVPTAPEQFLTLLPEVERHARRKFRHLNRPDRDEAVAESVASAFVSSASLSHRGIDPKRFSALIARYAACHVCDGRLVGGPRNSRDVFDRRTRTGNGVRIIPLSDEVLVDHRTPVPDQVAFRIDFGEFLRSLPTRHRAMAMALAEGEPAVEVARRFGVSPARVTQLRKDWMARWLEFRGERLTPASHINTKQ